MPGSVCSVAICTNHSGKAKKLGEPLRFFSFPKDPRIRRQWIMRCRRRDKINPVNARVCSKHFVPDDFEDAIRARLLGGQPMRLKSNAVPSVFLVPEKLCQRKSRERSSKYSKARDRQEMIQKLLATSTREQDNKKLLGTSTGEQHNKFLAASTGELNNKLLPPSTSEQDNKELLAPSTGEQNYNKVSVTSSLTAVLLKEKIYGPSMEQKLQQLAKQNNELRRITANLEANMIAQHKKNKALLEKYESLHKKYQSALEETEKLKSEKKSVSLNFEQKCKQLLQSCLTPNQIDILLEKKTKARWTREELNRAFTLRYLSPESYLYLKNTLKFPLPGLSTLRRYKKMEAGHSQITDQFMESLIETDNGESDFETDIEESDIDIDNEQSDIDIDIEESDIDIDIEESNIDLNKSIKISIK